MSQGEDSVQTDVKVDSTHKLTEHYDVQERLGGGRFGIIYRLIHKETGHVYAGKFYIRRSDKAREAARKEIDLTKQLHHNNLVRCFAAYDLKPDMVMVMEYIAGGELFDRIMDDNFEYTEHASVGYMQQILEGIEYMHQKNIVHLDLKPDNIVCVDHTGTSIKIIDFGLAHKLDPNTPLKVLHRASEYVSPEVLNYDPVYLTTDMWSIGVICYILLSGMSPFQGDSDNETRVNVVAVKWEFDEESFKDISELAKNFISSLLKKSPRQRMSCKEALAHPWMATFNSVDSNTTKSRDKEKMRKFVARQKWKQATNVALAAVRMMGQATLGCRDSPASELQKATNVALAAVAMMGQATLGCPDSPASELQKATNVALAAVAMMGQATLGCPDSPASELQDTQ